MHIKKKRQPPLYFDSLHFGQAFSKVLFIDGMPGYPVLFSYSRRVKAVLIKSLYTPKGSSLQLRRQYVMIHHRLSWQLYVVCGTFAIFGEGKSMEFNPSPDQVKVFLYKLC